MSNIKATIYLKSGGDISMNIYDTSLEEQMKVYSNNLSGDRDKNVFIYNGPDAIQIVPSDNVAASLRKMKIR